MDNDISHAVEERLAAIEARLDVLEGNGEVTEEGEEDHVEVGDDYVQPVAASRRGRRTTASVEPTVIESSTIEGVEL